MRDQIERLIEERLLENLLNHADELPNRKPYLPLAEWLRLKSVQEQHRLNQTKRKLAALKC